MTAVAPARIRAAFDLVTVPGAVLSGIVGDQKHSFGYHLSPNDLRALGESGDYSLTLPRDRAGAAARPDEASAMDISLPPTQMVLVTRRLIAAAQAHDPRMTGLREFCGTTNGSTPHPYDVASGTDDPNNSGGWDSSHVWHVHASFYRDATAAEVATVMQVINGAAGTTTTGDDGDMNADQDKRLKDVEADAQTAQYVLTQQVAPAVGAIRTMVLGLVQHTGAPVDTSALVDGIAKDVIAALQGNDAATPSEVEQAVRNVLGSLNDKSA